MKNFIYWIEIISSMSILLIFNNELQNTLSGNDQFCHKEE